MLKPIVNYIAKKIKVFGIIAFVVLIAVISMFLLSNKLSVSKVQAATNQTVTDVNGDGFIDLADARTLAPPATVNCPVCVDVNGDKKIDQKDVDLVQARVGKPSLYRTRFDVNNDGVIDSNDVDIVKKYLGQTVTGPAFGMDNPSELTFGFLANDLMVKFKPGTTQQQKDDIYKKYGLKSVSDFSLINSTELHASDSNVENLQKQLSNETLVEKAKKSELLEPMTNDPNWGDQWAIPKMNLLPAWYLGITGKSSVRVGLVDTGADYTHPDLGNLSTTLRYDAVTGSAQPFSGQDLSDGLGHGTHMAGIIGATANNGIAIAGVNWNVEIVPVKACIPQAVVFAVCPVPYLLRALEWLSAQDNINVINLSLGSDTANDNDVNYYLDYFTYRNIPVVASAGNDGGDGCYWPASHPGVICVSATDNNDNFASCSGGRVDSNISAPGVNIMSTVPTGSILDPDHDGVESINCGTSMAAAYISGVVALCKTIQATNPKDNLQCGHFNNFDYTSNRRIDAWSYLWYRNCKIFDNTGPDGSPDGVVDLMDIEAIAFRATNYFTLYDPKYDVYPAGGDGVIDSRDLFVAAYGHYGDQCQ